MGMELVDDAVEGARVNTDFSPVLVEVPSAPVVKEVELQSLKKLSQCFAILERPTWHKSNKLPNILKIIYVMV